MSIYEKEQPKSENASLFIRLQDGETAKMRFIGDGIDYTRVFEGDDKPKIRFASLVIYRNMETKQNEMRVFDFGWSVQKQLKALLNDEDWGDLEGYDVAVTRTGEKLETKYTVIAKPKKELTDEEKQFIADANIDLRKVCKVGVTDDTPDGDYDPFGKEEGE